MEDLLEFLLLIIEVVITCLEGIEQAGKKRPE